MEWSLLSWEHSFIVHIMEMFLNGLFQETSAGCNLDMHPPVSAVASKCVPHHISILFLPNIWFRYMTDGAVFTCPTFASATHVDYDTCMHILFTVGGGCTSGNNTKTGSFVPSASAVRMMVFSWPSCCHKQCLCLSALMLSDSPSATVLISHPYFPYICVDIHLSSSGLWINQKVVNCLVYYFRRLLCASVTVFEAGHSADMLLDMASIHIKPIGHWFFRR